MPSRYFRWSTAISLLFVQFVATSGCESQPPSIEPIFRELIEQARRGETTEIIVGGQVIGDEELVLLVDVSSIKHLAIENFQGTTVGLEAIARLPNLERLQLRGGDLRDEAIAIIAGCAKLKNLNLPNARFSDSGLAELKSLTQLELLRFHTPNVTDDGLMQIAEMKSLRFLHLIGVPVTDQGIKHLESMTHLESLYIDDSQVTDEGIRRLYERGLHVHINQHHSDRDPNKGTHPH